MNRLEDMLGLPPVTQMRLWLECVPAAMSDDEKWVPQSELSPLDATLKIPDRPTANGSFVDSRYWLWFYTADGTSIGGHRLAHWAKPGDHVTFPKDSMPVFELPNGSAG